MRWAQGFSFPFILTGATALLAAGLAAAASAEPPENTAHTLPRAVAVSGGAHHTCALTEAGGVMCWGWNGVGQLGDGTTTDRLTPVAVKGLESGVKAIAAGFVYTCALLETGRVKCWGGNSDGELGDGTTTDRLRPVTLNLSRVKAIAAGPGHTCALTAKAGLCWGDNSFGELGDGTTTDSSTPVVYASEPDIVGISTGGYGHSCDVTRSGRARCWGFNGSGQLGDGTTTDSHSAELVIDLRSAVAIAAGNRHTCAVTDAGAAKCWGENQYGQLGDGTTTMRATPTAVRGLKSGVKAIAAGTAHTCALTEAGAIKCWGFNGNGQLGDGTTTERHTAGFVRKFRHGGAVAIAAGGEHNCAVTEPGGIRCWGRNDSGQLGDGTRTDRSTPVRVRGFPR